MSRHIDRSNMISLGANIFVCNGPGMNSIATHEGWIHFSVNRGYTWTSHATLACELLPIICNTLFSYQGDYKVE